MKLRLKLTANPRPEAVADLSARIMAIREAINATIYAHSASPGGTRILLARDMDALLAVQNVIQMANVDLMERFPDARGRG